MSDESLRPAQGRSSDRRHGAGAPVWWHHLDRNDLPDLERNAPRDSAALWFSSSVPPLIVENEDRPAPRHSHLRSWLVTLVVIVCASLLAIFGLGVTSPRGAAVSLALLGVPVAVVCVAVTVVKRRSS